MKQLMLLVGSLIILLIPSHLYAETAMLPTFPISLNQVRIDNDTREYPLLLYRDLTYFPMTYADCAFLGLGTQWDEERGLEVYKLDDASLFLDVGNSQVQPYSFRVFVTEFTFPVRVNEQLIDNASQEYPLFCYRDIVYFPLTWSFAVEGFNWDIQFDAQTGLSIASRGPLNLIDEETSTTLSLYAMKALGVGEYAYREESYKTPPRYGFVGSIISATDQAYINPRLYVKFSTGFGLNCDGAIDDNPYISLSAHTPQDILFMLDIGSAYTNQTREFLEAREPVMHSVYYDFHIEPSWNMRVADDEAVPFSGGAVSSMPPRWANTAVLLLGNMELDVALKRNTEVLAGSLSFNVVDSFTQEAFFSMPLPPLPEFIKGGMSINLPWWNGRDNDGNRCPAGKYSEIVRIEEAIVVKNVDTGEITTYTDADIDYRIRGLTLP